MQIDSKCARCKGKPFSVGAGELRGLYEGAVKDELIDECHREYRTSFCNGERRERGMQANLDVFRVLRSHDDDGGTGCHHIILVSHKRSAQNEDQVIRTI